MYNKLLWVEKFGSIVGFIVLSSLAFIALSEKEITTGSPKSSLITHSSGFSAVLLGFLFLVGALGCLYFCGHPQYIITVLTAVLTAVFVVLFFMV